MAGTRVVGLDIGATAVRAAQVSFGSGGPGGKQQPVLNKVAQVALPPGVVRDGEVIDAPVVSDALKQLWSQGKFDTKEVVVGVASQRILIRDMDLPWMPLPQLKASLPYQVQEVLPMSTDDAFLDFCVTDDYEGQSGRTLHGVLVAAQRDLVNVNVMAVVGAGLEPTMVDLTSFALIRALAQGDFAGRTVAIVDIGARLTNVVISEAGAPRLIRIVRAGGQDVTDAVATAMSVPAPEADVIKREVGIGYGVPPERQAAAAAINEATGNLIEAVRSTVGYYATNNPGAAVEAVVLSGGGAFLPGLGQYLSSVSRLPVVMGNPLAPLKLGKGSGGEQFSGYESLVATSIGLAYGVAA